MTENRPGVRIIPIHRKTPRIDPSAFIAPGCVIIGDVVIGPESSVWYNCVLRADVSRIECASEQEEAGAIALVLRQALEDHTGWLAVDATAWPKDIEPEEGYQMVGKLLAELSERRDSKALYLPATSQFIPYRDDTPAALRSDPLVAFERALDN